MEVADGGQAGIDTFRAANAQGEPFDAVITDMGMPYVSGRMVAQAVKGESPGMPVILLTGWGAHLRPEEIPVHVDCVLSKPPEVNALRRALEQVCAKKG